jgi:hypothetical protein
MNTFLSIPRSTDGYVNATQLCRAAGKRFDDYTSLDYTQEFFAVLSSMRGLTLDQLIQTRDGEIWVHPRVTVNFGMWLSPKIAAEVVNWVYDRMTGNLPSLPPTHNRSTAVN